MIEKFDDETLKEWAEPYQHIGVPAFVELLTQRQILAREVLKYREDSEIAAGECLVPIPDPGSHMARLLSANVLLRRENEELRKSLKKNGENNEDS